MTSAKTTTRATTRAKTKPSKPTSRGKTKQAAPARTRPTQRVLDALTEHGPLQNDGQPWDARLDAEQRARALTAPAGLSGKAAATYVLTGQNAREQIAAAKQAKGAKGKPAPVTPAGKPGKVGERVAGDTPAERTTNHVAGVRAAAAEQDAASAGPRPLREGSALHAAAAVLADASEPMSAQEIYDAAVARGLAGGLKGKTPVQTLAARLAVANKKGELVERSAPGRYQLRASEARA